MLLCVIFWVLNIQLGHIFAFPQNPTELSAQSNHHKRIGYECGNVFFTDPEVRDALLLAIASFGKGTQFPQTYQDELYGDSRFEEYFLYPIIKGSLFHPYHKALKSVFRIVFTRNSKEVVDVVAKITNGHYTKCIRSDSAHIGPSNSVQEITSGYQCGYNFVTAEILRQSLALAQNKVEDKSGYPISYVGHLYPENSGYLMWPISRGKSLYRSGTWNIGPHYLILDDKRQFVDVVVKGYSNNFLRCIRPRKPPKSPISDPYSNLFVQPPRPGYFCGKVFFEQKILEAHAEKIEKQDGIPIKGQSLKKYSGPPYDQPCLIWPIMNDGSLYKWGHKGVLRLVLTADYKVMSVAISIEGKLKPCERATITAKKNHDKSDYQCNKNQLSHEQLLEAAEKACLKLNVKRNTYPAKYKGPEFGVKGPYFTFPVYRDGSVGRHGVGQHRVVINTNCEIAGALTTVNDNNSRGTNDRPLKRLVKCHRKDDGPLPHDFFGVNAETVYEFYLRRKNN